MKTIDRHSWLLSEIRFRLLVASVILSCLCSPCKADDKYIADMERRFPFYKQDDQISCGPVCVSMVLKYFGTDAGIGPLKTKCGTRLMEYGGINIGFTTPSGIKEGFEGYGAKARIVLDASFSDIRNAIDTNHPPILLVRSGNDTWHFIVAVGYSDSAGKKYYHIADPGYSKIRKLEESAISKGWSYSGTYEGKDVANAGSPIRKAIELAVGNYVLIVPCHY